MESSRQKKSARPDHRGDSKGDDKPGTEPVVFLALVEHDLQCADGDDEQPKAPVVDAFAALANVGQIRRVFDDAVGEIERRGCRPEC